MIPCVFITVLSITLFSGAAQPKGYQANKVILVALGDTITLQCSVKNDAILWYQQIDGYQPQIISSFQKMGENKFYSKFNNGRFQRSNFNLTISNIIQSDEAIYHCGSRGLYVTFGIGTRLMIKGQKDSSTTASTITKSLNQSYLNDSMKCQQNRFENRTKQSKNEEQQDPVVIGLAVALGLCGVLIIILMCLIYKREMCQQCTEGQDRVTEPSGAQETDDENLTYAALRFSRKKVKLQKVCTSTLYDLQTF